MQHFVLEVQTFRFTDALKIVKALELLTLTDPAEAWFKMANYCLVGVGAGRKLIENAWYK